MNIVACVFFVYFGLNLLQKKAVISRSTRFFLYLGTVLPVMDYFLRFSVGEIWFQTEGLIFHSFVYQSLFWGIASILVWVYIRDIRKAGKLLFPLVGLLMYTVFSVFSMENISFLTPLSSASFSLGWVIPGYLIPTVILIVFWITAIGSDLSKTLVSILALLSLIGFIVYAGISYHRINQDLKSVFPNPQVVSIAPVNHQQTMWRVVTKHQDNYSLSHFHFIQGQHGEVEEHPSLNESETAQMALLDPVIWEIFQKAFRNPVIQIDIQNESMLVTISELVPLIEPLWVKKIQLRKNRSGQIVFFDIDYGTFF